MLTPHRFRAILWLSALFNTGVAMVFLQPASPLGALAGLPPEVPLVYRAFVALFVLLFGGMYAWLAWQPHPARPLVMLAAIGKAAAFGLVSLLYLAGAIPGSGVLVACGDLVLALVFMAWLRHSPTP